MKNETQSLNLKDINVLIVDNNEFSRNFTHKLCHSYKFKETLTATTAEDALPFLKNKKIDLVLCEWKLGSSSAAGFVKQVRNAPALPNPAVPIIILGSIDDQSAVYEARDAGITDWLARPLAFPRLINCLETCFNTSRPFIREHSYTGPCRRRRQKDFTGTERRRKEKPAVLVVPEMIKLFEGLRKPGGLTFDEMIKIGQEIIRQEEEAYRSIRNEELQLLFALIKTLKANRSSAYDLLQQIYSNVENLRSWGQIFGYPLLTKVGALMNTLIRGLPPNAMENLFFLQAIETHATVMKLIIDSDMRDEEAELAREVIEELQALVNKALSTSAA